MNFKKFHESRNLFSEKYENRSINGVGTFVIDNNYDLWIGEVVAGQTYTISNMDSVYGFFTAKPLPNTGVTYDGTRGYESSGTAVVTVPSGCTWIAVRVLHNADNAMLNTGSTALPYEPYSSEVWHDIPYYQHKTATDTLTLPATLYPNDTSITVGLKGNEEHTGTPSPQNPVDANGTGERTENLAYGRIDTANVFSNGTIVRAGDYDVAIGRVESGIVYTVNSYVLAFYTDEPATGSVSYDGSRIVATAGRPTTFTAPITGYVAFRLNSGEQAMLNLGSTALPYEPYGYKIPILSNSITMPVYLGEVQTTRNIKKYEFTGQESINIHLPYSRFYFTLNDSLIIGVRKTPAFCTHWQVIDDDRPIADVPNNALYSDSGNSRWFIKTTDYTTADGFKAYLAQQYAAGTPVTVWYVLATEQTGIVNEPLMKIGDYADTLSNISIPVTAGGDTLSVGTTVQPSEVTVNYKGWHPVADVHERTNGAWT